MMKTERMVGASCPGLGARKDAPIEQPAEDLIDVNKLMVCTEPAREAATEPAKAEPKAMDTSWGVARIPGTHTW